MVEGSQLEEIGIACLRIATVQFFGKLQHVVGITALRAVDVSNKVLAGFLAWEVLTTAVAAKGESALTCHDVPEIGSCGMVRLIAGKLCDALKAHYLWHLCIGVHIVEAVATLHHG